jgi:hypothetical protein
MSDSGLEQTDHINRKITLTVIILSGYYCSLNIVIKTSIAFCEDHNAPNKTLLAIQNEITIYLHRFNIVKNAKT